MDDGPWSTGTLPRTSSRSASSTVTRLPWVSHTYIRRVAALTARQLGYSPTGRVASSWFVPPSSTDSLFSVRLVTRTRSFVGSTASAAGEAGTGRRFSSSPEGPSNWARVAPIHSLTYTWWLRSETATPAGRKGSRTS